MEQSTSMHINIKFPGMIVGRIVLIGVLMALLIPGASLARSPGQALLEQGTEHYRNGRYGQAREAFRLSIERDPGLMTAWENLGWACVKTDQPEKAERIWAMLLKVEPARVSTINALGSLYLEQGRWQAAVRLFSKTWRLDKSKAETLLLLGDAYKSGKAFEQALRCYRLACDHFKPNGDCLLRLASLLEQIKDPDGAIDLLLRHKAALRDSIAAKKLLARLYAELGNRYFAEKAYDKASDAYEKALSWRPCFAQVFKSLGWAYWNQSSWKQCEQSWRLYAECFPRSVEPYNLLSRLYLFRNRHTEAIAAAKQSLALDSNQPLTALRCAKACFTSGQYTSGKREIERLVEQYPDHPAIRKYWAEVLMLYQDFRKGERQWRKVLNMGYDSPKAHYFWIKSMHENAKQDQAVRTAQLYMQENGDHDSLLQLLRDDALARGNVTLAAGYAKRMLALPQAANNPDAWLRTAQLYRQIHEDQKALQALQKALTHLPQNNEVELTIAELQLSMGQHDNAYNDFMRIYSRYPFTRRAYLGIYHSLVAAGRYDTASKWLEKNEVCFFGADQLQLERERLNALLHSADTTQSGGGFDGARRKHIPILFYHGLSENERSDNLPIERFELQMAALKHAGYTTITVEELAKSVEQGTDLPARPILITADDAQRDFFRLADPVLKKFGMRATMFVPTALTESDHPFFADWPTLRRYHRTGRWDIQSHGHQAHLPITIDSAGTQG
jgi:tetratricopeptide (TPR) repeat protein